MSKFLRFNNKSITIGGINIGSKGVYGNTPFGRMRLDTPSTPPPPDPLTLPDTPCPTLEQTRLRGATKVAYVLWTLLLMLLCILIKYPYAAIAVPVIMWLIARRHRRTKWEYNVAKWRDYHKS